MRGAIALIAAALVSTTTTGAFAAGKFRLAQTSNATNCMMNCHAQVAACRTTCVVPGGAGATTPTPPPTVAGTPNPNASANTACILNCSTAHLACQTACAQQLPSP